MDIDWESIIDYLPEADEYFDGSHLEFHFDLPTETVDLFGIKKSQLSLDELYDLYMTDNFAYERKRLSTNVETDEKGVRSVRIVDNWQEVTHHTLLYRHIVAEQLFHGDLSKIDWEGEYYDNTYKLASLFTLWLNPLRWEKPTRLTDVVVEGRVAVEDFDTTREKRVVDVYKYISKMFALKFADNPEEFPTDDPFDGEYAGIHNWSRIADGNSWEIQSILEGGRSTRDDIRRSPSYHAATLRRNLAIIAEYRGGKRAAELLRMLQQEWPTIKVYKVNMTYMRTEHIQQFETALYKGFDDLLVKWEDPHMATPQSQETHLHFHKPVKNVIANVENLNINES